MDGRELRLEMSTIPPSCRVISLSGFFVNLWDKIIPPPVQVSSQLFNGSSYAAASLFDLLPFCLRREHCFPVFSNSPSLILGVASAAARVHSLIHTHIPEHPWQCEWRLAAVPPPVLTVQLRRRALHTRDRSSGWLPKFEIIRFPRGSSLVGNGGAGSVCIAQNELWEADSFCLLCNFAQTAVALSGKRRKHSMEKGLKRKTFWSSDPHIYLSTAPFHSRQAAASSQRGINWPVLYVSGFSLTPPC